MSKILITGGAGFLGQHLCLQLANLGHSITVVDLRPASRPIYDLSSLCEDELYGIDITQEASLDEILGEFDCVYHLAGLVSFWRRDANRLREINVTGTRHVAESAFRARVPRFIHVSSVAAVGFNQQNDEPIDESYQFAWSKASSKHYMLSKHESEVIVRDLAARGLNAIIANPGLMWGPGDRINSARLFDGLRRGIVPACPPGGTNIVDVRDVANALSVMLHAGEYGERYILGGENLTFAEVYSVICDVLGVANPSWLLPRRIRPILRAARLASELMSRTTSGVSADQIDSAFRLRYFRSEKARTELGWDPRISFRDTIEESIAWLDQSIPVPVSV